MRVRLTADALQSLRMKALYIDRHGPPENLKVSEIPKPSPGPNDVLIQVEAAGINPSDLASVEGKFLGSVLPRIVGRDFAGKIVEGPPDLIGAEVWGSGGDLGVTRDGTNAEFLSLPQQAISLRPKKLTAEQAAAVGVPFITAYSAVMLLGHLKEGEWIVISGALGSVGQAASQIARSQGAHVVALIKDSAEKSNPALKLVDAVAQSDQNDLNRIVRSLTKNKGADLAINAVGAPIFSMLLESLSIGGRLVLFSAAGGRETTLDIMNFYKNQLAMFGLDTQKLDAAACAAILNDLAPLFDSGKLDPPAIAEQFPLTNAAQAYQRVAQGKSGKVVLLMN
jgi:NADPH:quinone reductase